MSEELVNRDCPVCRSGDRRFLLEKPLVRLHRCSQCGMIYASPVLSTLVTGEYYNTSADYYLSPEKLRADYSVVRFERELKFFRKFCQRGKVLDVGCSSGAFLWNLGRLYPGDYDLVGTDASGPPLDHAEKQGIRVERGDFLELALGEGSFDAVTFWAVLEHLENPKAFIERARELLKPGGQVFALVPNYGSLAFRLLGARYRYIYEQHLNYFSRRTLSLLFEGWRIGELRSTHFNPVILWQDWRGGARVVPGAERARLLSRTTRLKERPWLAPLNWGYKASEKVLGTVSLADNLMLVARKEVP